jgi:hypothetical protein
MIFPSNLGKYKIHITESPTYTYFSRLTYLFTGLLEYIHITTIHLQSYYKYAYSPITILLVLQLFFRPLSASSASDMEYYQCSG